MLFVDSVTSVYQRNLIPLRCVSFFDRCATRGCPDRRCCSEQAARLISARPETPLRKSSPVCAHHLLRATQRLRVQRHHRRHALAVYQWTTTTATSSSTTTSYLFTVAANTKPTTRLALAPQPAYAYARSPPASQSTPSPPSLVAVPAFLSDRQYYSVAARLSAVSTNIAKLTPVRHNIHGHHSHYVRTKAVESSHAVQHEEKVALAVRARYHGA